MSYKLRLLYEVSKLYYIEDLKQESIGRRLKISKYTVSRILKRAKNKGLVKIQVVKPDYNNEEI